MHTQAEQSIAEHVHCVWYLMCSKTGWRMVSVKGQITGIFSFLGHYVSVTYSGEADSVCTYRKGVLCPNKTLFTQRGGRLRVPQVVVGWPLLYLACLQGGLFIGTAGIQRGPW